MGSSLGQYSNSLSPNTQAYVDESIQAGREAVARIRALRGLTMGPLQQAQVTGQQPTVRELSTMVTGIAPAPLPEAVDTIMRNNPRDGREFNLFDSRRITQSYGESLRAEEDQLVNTDPRTTSMPLMTGNAVPERSFLDKVGRVVRALGIYDGAFDEPVDEAAIAAQRKQMLAGAGQALVESVNNIAQFGLTFLDTFGAGDRYQRKINEAEAGGGTGAEKLQRRHNAFRLETAQRMLNNINEFKKNVSAQARYEGVPEAEVREAETWGSNSGYMIGMIPLAAFAEVGIASRMAAATTGLSARSIMGSSLLRHGIASAGANMVVTPFGSPLVPESAENASLGQQAEDFFLTPNYAGAAVLGGGLGVAGAWIANKIAAALRPKQNRSVPVVWDETRGFHKQQVPNVDPNLDVPIADWEIVRDAAAPAARSPLDEGYIFGQRALPETASGPFFMDTPAQARPLAGLLTDGSEKIGFVGDPNGPIFPAPARDVNVNPFTTEVSVDASIDVTRNRSVDVSVDATWTPPKPRARSKTATQKVGPINVENPIAIALQPVEPFAITVVGEPGPSLLNFEQPLTGPISTLPDFGGLPDLPPITGLDMQFAGIVPPPSAGPLSDSFGAPPALFGNEPMEFDFGMAGGDYPAPATNAPAIVPTAEEIVPSPYTPSVIAEPVAPTPSVQETVNLAQPITVEERLVEAGLEPESAALITVDEEATVPAERARMPESVLTGADIARALGSKYVGPDGQPKLIFGTGSAADVRVFNENGTQSLVAGRGVLYFTDNPGDAGGFVDQQYGVQELGGQLVPAPTSSAQPVPNVTNNVRQALMSMEQTRAKIQRMKRDLRTMGTGGNADVQRQKINAAESLLKKQQVPASAITPMYLTSRRHVNLNEPIRSDVRSMDPAERTPTEDAFVAAIESMINMAPARTTAVVVERILPMIEEGRFNGALGARDLYNSLAFNVAGETMQTKGSIFNKALQSIGVDSMSMKIVPEISGGNSQVGSLGSETVIVLDPRALVPAYAVDDIVLAESAAFHGVQMSKLATVISDPARPDLAQVRNIGDIDYVGSRLIVQQNEHVMVRNPDNAFELAQSAQREYPEAFVQVVTGPDKTAHVYVGAKPMTAEAMKQYELTGYHANQMVRDVRGKVDRRVYTVDDPESTKPRVVLYPDADRPYSQWPGFDLTPANRANFIPGTAAGPVIDGNGQAMWNDFQEFASGYIAELNGAGKTQIESLFEPDAAQLLPSILTDWFEEKGIFNVLQRKALTTLFDGELVREYRALAPEANAFFDGAKKMYDDVTAGAPYPPTIHELASARGKYVIDVPGGPEIVIKDGTTAHMQMFESEPAARTFLENYEPVEMPVEIGSTMPSAVGQAPSFETVPPPRTDPIVDSLDLDDVAADADVAAAVDDALPLTREMAEETGEGAFGPQEYIDVDPGNVEPELVQPAERTPGGTTAPPELNRTLSDRARRGRSVLNRALGWLQPNHSFFAKMEAMLEAAGLDTLRPYADTQILKRQQAIALEKGNPAYKALEKIRRMANRELIVNGQAWKILSLPDRAQRVAYVAANKLDPSILTTVDQLDAVVDLIFETPAARKAHWQNLVTYINKIGSNQTLNRVAPIPFQANLYDNAAVGLNNIDWFQAHAYQTRMMAETVNSIQMLETIAHSYNFARYVKPSADKVKSVWAQIGALEVNTVPGRDATPLKPYADEVLDWVSILETGEVAGTRDWIPELVAKMAGWAGAPMTKGEAKRLLSLGMGNLTKGFMGWTPAPAMRDFTKFLDTTSYVGPQAISEAIANFTNPKLRAATFQRLKALGLASTENELQSSSPYLNSLIGEDELYSSFSAREIANRQRLQNAADAVINATPQRIRDLADTGMYAYIKSNALSRALSAEAAHIRFTRIMKDFGLDGLTGAQYVNLKLADPKLASRLLDKLKVGTKASSRLIDDMLSDGNQTAALTEYVQHIVAMSQGMYGPLHTGKAFRTVTGRMGLMFQNFGIGMIDMATNALGLNDGARKMAAIERAKLASSMALISGGTAYVYQVINEKYGYDVRNWSYWNTVANQVPIQPGPVADAAITSIGTLDAWLSQNSDYPRRAPSGRGLMTTAFDMAVPMARPIGRYTDLLGNALNSNSASDEVLNFILTNKSGVNMAETRRDATQRAETADSIANGAGGGAF